MPGPLLYSANPWIKYHIQKQYRGDRHYVWCSETFDGALLSPLDRGAFVAPSSNPAQIYRELAEAVRKGDRHCARIGELRLGIKQRATQWHLDGNLGTADLEEITALTDSLDLAVWKPYLYIIPRQSVESRIERVPPDERAGVTIEYRIADLNGSDFDIVQL